MSTYESILEINPWGRLTTASTTTTNIQIQTTSGVQYQVAWGDGTVTTHNSNTIATKTYSVAHVGDVYFRAVSGRLKNINQLQITAGYWNFDISTLKYYVSNLTYLYLYSDTSTWSGDIAYAPTGLTVLYLRSNLSTWSGDIAYAPTGLTTLYLISNLSTWSGDIAYAPTGLTVLYLSSTLSTWTYTAGRVWKNMTQLYIRPKVGTITSTEVDNIFIDLDASPLVTGAGTIDLRGDCGAPTSASLSARNSLVSKGKTVLHN